MPARHLLQLEIIGGERGVFVFQNRLSFVFEIGIEKRNPVSIDQTDIKLSRHARFGRARAAAINPSQMSGLFQLDKNAGGLAWRYAPLGPCKNGVMPTSSV